MQAGEYNQLISILRKTIVETDYTQKEEWSELIQTRASVKHLSGNREERSMERFYSDLVEFTVRYYICSDLDDEDHILWQDKEYRITNIFRDSLTTSRHVVITAELINK